MMRGKDSGHTKSGQLRQRGQYGIQHEMMMNDEKSLISTNLFSKAMFRTANIICL